MTKRVRGGIFVLVTMLLFIVTLSLSASVIVSYAEEFYSVTIEYVYQDETPAYEPYVAVYASGEDVDVNVRNPVIQGYKAVVSLEPDAADAHFTKLSFENISEDHTIKVYYVPDKVNYRVKYFFQNIQDDSFTENLTLDTDYYVKSGYTGDYPTELDKLEFDGFILLPHDFDSISADGSTIYELYYERNYSLISFDLDGGYGVEPVYAKYNSNYNIAVPTKQGYDFVGWAQTNEDGEFINAEGTVISDDEAKEGATQFTSGIVPANNLYYKAIWEAKLTKYTVIYRIENADDDSYSFAYSEELEALSGTEVTGPDNWNGTLANTEVSEKEYYTFSSSDTKTIEGDGSTIINVYYKRNVYKLRFYYARKIGETYSVSSKTRNFESGASDNELSRMYYSEWKNIEGEPKIKEDFNLRNYTTGTETFTGNSGEATFYYIEFEAKYGSFIGDLWPLDFIEPVSTGDGNAGFFATWASSKNSYYANQNPDNPNIKGSYRILDKRILIENNASEKNVSFLAYWATGSNTVRWIYEIYVPVLDDSEQVDFVYQNINYKKLVDYEMFTTSTTIKEQTPTDLKGFTFFYSEIGSTQTGGYKYTDNNGNEKSITLYTGRFFYTRDKYQLEFQNGGNTGFSDAVSYQKPLAQYYYIPEYYIPELSQFYEFGGWYTTAACIEGTEFDLKNSTMPANGIVLYSKWDPVEYDVTFYNDLNAYNANEPLAETLKVDYNSTIPSKNIPTRKRPSANAQFLGWYYINDDGTATNFDPLSMPITKSLKLYAEWTSKTTTKYTIKYVKKGTDVEIADSIQGFAFVSSTKTFQAKGGSDLIESGWWPTLASHSILLEADENQNIFTFSYIKKESVWYTVKYINAVTGELIESKEVESNNGVVTESAKYEEGFVVDSITKSCVLAASDNDDKDAAKSEELAKNVINFYYTENTENITYEVKHLVQDADDDTVYTLYRDENFTALKNETVNVKTLSLDAITSSGFTVDWDMTTVNGSVDVNESVNVTPSTGDESYVVIELYYVRNKYPYTVRYVEYETDRELYKEVFEGENAEPVGKEISINPPNPYTPVGENQSYERISTAQLSITIGVEDSEHKNILNVYYQKQETFAIDYNTVCVPQAPDGFNSEVRLSQSQEIVSSVSESTGSRIISYPEEKYEFLGWFNNPEGTGDPITKDVKLDPYAQFGGIIHDDITFYAVFAPYITADVSYKYSDDKGITWKTDAAVDGLSATFSDDTTDQKKIKLGSLISLSASTTNSDYEFIGWFVNDDDDMVLKGANPVHTPTANVTYVARFVKRAPISYTLFYHYTDRNGTQKTYKKTDILPYYLTEITEEFAYYTAAPHESVFGVELIWSSIQFTDDTRTTAHVYSTNSAKTLNLTYPNFIDNDAANYTVVTKTGLAFKEVPEYVTSDRYITAPSNRTVSVFDQKGKPVIDKATKAQMTVTQKFAYWSIKLTKDVRKAGDFSDAKEYNRCYAKTFNYIMSDDLWIEPVYIDESDYLANSDNNNNIQSSINFLGYTRDQWSDNPNSDSNTNYNTTDKIYIDFIATYQYNNEQLVYDKYSYETVDDGTGGTKVVAKLLGKEHSENVTDAGIAIEICGTVDEVTAKTEGFADNLIKYADPEDEQALENNIASRNTNGGRIIYSKNYIAENALGNKNSVHYIGSFSNSDFKPTKEGINKSGRAYQILRVYSFMKLHDGTVVISDPVYINTYQIASAAS